MKKRVVIEFEVTFMHLHLVEQYTGSKNLTVAEAAVEAVDAIDLSELKAIVGDVTMTVEDDDIEGAIHHEEGKKDGTPNY